MLSSSFIITKLDYIFLLIQSLFSTHYKNIKLINLHRYCPIDIRLKVQLPLEVYKMYIVIIFSVAFVAPVPGNVYNPGEDPYPHGISLQDRLGEARPNPNKIE